MSCLEARDIETEYILRNRINELNDMIGELNTENDELKDKLKYTKCLHTVYFVKDIINDILQMDFSAQDILDITKDASIVGEDFVTDIFIDEEKSKSIKLFSILGAAKMLSFLQNTVCNIDSEIKSCSDILPENINNSIENIHRNYK